jgi:flagella basal body P-ring formation protein FlgA
MAFAQDQARQPQYELLPVPAVTIYPGDIIVEGMLTEAHFLPGTLAMYPVADARAAVVGKVARRTLTPDRLIPLNAIAEPELVARGSMIRVTYQAAGLNISANMLALEGGALGKFIQVRNIDSGRVVMGVVQADGTVLVGDGS